MTATILNFKILNFEKITANILNFEILNFQKMTANILRFQNLKKNPSINILIYLNIFSHHSIVFSPIKNIFH
jgi:hypothetical protein